MSSGQEMTQAVRERMARDGVDLDSTVSMTPDGTPAQGTGGDQATLTQQPTSSAGTSNTDGQQGQGTPDTIPYSRFTEVNNRLQQLRQYEDLQRLGIEPDSAVRLANFEAAYIADPTGTIAQMVDTLDLPAANKTALRALLAEQAAAQDDGTTDDSTPVVLPDEVKDAVSYVRESRQRDEQRDVQNRLDHAVGHWQQLDKDDSLTGTTDRQRLMYIQTVAGSERSFETLEQLSEAARDLYLEDRDANLGAAVSTSRTGRPLAVPSGGVPPTGALPPPKTMGEARKRIEADIAAGRLPDLSSE